MKSLTDNLRDQRIAFLQTELIRIEQALADYEAANLKHATAYAIWQAARATFSALPVNKALSKSHLEAFEAAKVADDLALAEWSLAYAKATDLPTYEEIGAMRHELANLQAQPELL